MTGPHAMDWATYAAARQYLAEMRIGTRLREVERAEDDDFREARKQLEYRR